MQSAKESSLVQYYQELFPADEIFSWLKYVTNREFSFTLPEKVYQRYITASSGSQLRRQMVSSRPEKIDIGPVYAQKPGSVSINGQAVVMRELIFDVDLTDYNRACCPEKEKGMCNGCLPLVQCAVEVLDHILRKHFGFGRLLFVFSGGRGMHCWVSDPTALLLTPGDRKSIAEYMTEYLCTHRDPEVDRVLVKYRSQIPVRENNPETEPDMELLYKEVYPKLDISVTTQQNHLLKAPFCVHPRTQRICVPLSPHRFQQVQLEDIPKLSDVLGDPRKLQVYIDEFRSYVNSHA